MRRQMSSLKSRYIRDGNRRKNSEDPILPLVNIVFLLLIFFMVSGQFKKSDPFALTPPESTSTRETALQDAIIHLSRDGRLALQNAEISRSDLKTRLKAYLAENPNAPVRLKVDRNHKAGEVLTLLLTLREAGLDKVFLLTKTGKS